MRFGYLVYSLGYDYESSPNILNQYSTINDKSIELHNRCQYKSFVIRGISKNFEGILLLPICHLDSNSKLYHPFAYSS